MGYFVQAKSSIERGHFVRGGQARLLVFGVAGRSQRMNVEEVVEHQGFVFDTPHV